MSDKLNLDKLDYQIIQAMMDNADMSYADLGKKLFVSGGTIHVRIKKLQELGIVRGTKLHIDHKVLGYDVIAFIGIYLEKSSLYDAVAKELKKIPEIIRLNYTTGNYSMIIRCSSPKSSLIKISSAMLSLISHSPPFNMVLVSTDSIVFNFLIYNFLSPASEYYRLRCVTPLYA